MKDLSAAEIRKAWLEQGYRKAEDLNFGSMKFDTLAR